MRECNVDTGEYTTTLLFFQTLGSTVHRRTHNHSTIMGENHNFLKLPNNFGKGYFVSSRRNKRSFISTAPPTIALSPPRLPTIVAATEHHIPLPLCPLRSTSMAKSKMPVVAFKISTNSFTVGFRPMPTPLRQKQSVGGVVSVATSSSRC